MIYKTKRMYHCECGKGFEKQRSLSTHARFCDKYVKKTKKTEYLQNGSYECECGRRFEKHQSLNSHFSRCTIHRNGVHPAKRRHGGGWNRGLTAETSESVKKNAESVKGKGGRVWTDEDRRNHSRIMKGKSGGCREGSNRWKGIKINHKNREVWLDSSYELRFVNVLKKFGIDWEKNYRKFPYDYQGMHRKYIPDFWLHELNLWVETKGMLKEIDGYKWKQFPYQLTVLFNKQLVDLEKLDSAEDVKTYIKGLVLKSADNQD